MLKSTGVSEEDGSTSSTIVRNLLHDLIPSFTESEHPGQSTLTDTGSFGNENGSAPEPDTSSREANGINAVLDMNREYDGATFVLQANGEYGEDTCMLKEHSGLINETSRSSQDINGSISVASVASDLDLSSGTSGGSSGGNLTFSSGSGNNSGGATNISRRTGHNNDGGSIEPTSGSSALRMSGTISVSSGDVAGQNVKGGAAFLSIDKSTSRKGGSIDMMSSSSKDSSGSISVSTGSSDSLVSKGLLGLSSGTIVQNNVRNVAFLPGSRSCGDDINMSCRTGRNKDCGSIELTSGASALRMLGAVSVSLKDVGGHNAKSGAAVLSRGQSTIRKSKSIDSTQSDALALASGKSTSRKSQSMDVKSSSSTDSSSSIAPESTDLFAARCLLNLSNFIASNSSKINLNLPGRTKYNNSSDSVAFTSGSRASTIPGTTSAYSGDIAGDDVESDTVALASRKSTVGKSGSINMKLRSSQDSSGSYPTLSYPSNAKSSSSSRGNVTLSSGSGNSSKGGFNVSGSLVYSNNSSNIELLSFTKFLPVHQINSIDEYLPSVSFLLAKLEALVNGLLFQLAQNSPVSPSNSVIASLRKLVSTNIHYSNITYLLANFHHYTQTTKLRTKPPLHLVFCSGTCHTTPSPEKKNTICNTPILYIYEPWPSTVSRCPTCKAAIISWKKREGRKRQKEQSGVLPNSKCNWKYLSDEASRKRRRNCTIEKYSLKKKLKKAMELQEKIKLDPDSQTEGQILNLIQKAGTVPKDVYNKFRKDLINGLLSDLSTSASTTNPTLQEHKHHIEEFVDEVLNKIKNFKVCRLENEPHKARFTPREIRIALTLYNRSPAGYKEFRESSIAIMPSVSSMKKYRTELRTSEGEAPAVYGTLRDRLNINQTSAKVHGQLMVDEMKLKNDIYTNVSSGEIVGFASLSGDFTSVRDDVRGIVKIVNEQQDRKVTSNTSTPNESQPLTNSDNACTGTKKKQEGKKSSTAASYVNQFRFRTSRNKTSCIEFFFTNGSLSANDILCQLLHVLSMLNNANMVTHGLCLDAGGNNSGLMSLLRHGAKLGDVGWLDDEKLISFKDPTSSSNHRIALMHCSTHNQKALRNAFLHSASSSETSRHFLSADNVRFTWYGCVKECFERDRANDVPVTNLDLNSVFLNAWNKMRVGYSLRPFSEKTLNEQFTHLGKILGCAKDMLYNGNFSENKDIPTMHKKRLLILKHSLEETVTLPERELKKVKEKLAGLEYSVHVACIFNERFMNKNMHITMQNVNRLESEMMDSLKYFEDWRKAASSRKSVDPDWEKGCISAQTYNNLRLQVAGFFMFARNLLAADTTVKFVPFLYSNQSSLESHFSQMRASGSDSPQKYIAGIASIEARKVAKTLSMHKNTWYDGGVDDKEVAVPYTSLEHAMKLTISSRKEIVDSWLEEGTRCAYEPSPTTVADQPVPVLDNDAFAMYLSSFLNSNARQNKYYSSNKGVFDAMLRAIQNKTIPSDYRTFLLNNTKMREIATSSVGSGSSTESWFKMLLSTKNQNDLLLLNQACQRAVAKLLVLFQSSCMVGDRSKKSNFWYQVFLSIDNDATLGATGPFSCLPDSLRLNQTGLYIIFENLAKTLQTWLHKEKQHTSETNAVTTPTNSIHSIENEKKKVNGFFGFAVGKLILDYKNKIETTRDKSKKSEVESVVRFLKGMRILHAEALQDEEYCRNCYAEIHQMLNRGGLTLISPHFFDFGKELLRKCDNELSATKIHSIGNESFIEGQGKIISCTKLRATFDRSCASPSLPSDMKKIVSCISKQQMDTIYGQLLKRTINSRFGVEITKVREKTTSHFANHSCKDAHRDTLKHDYAKRKMKEDGKLADAGIKRKKTQVAAATTPATML